MHFGRIKSRIKYGTEITCMHFLLFTTSTIPYKQVRTYSLRSSVFLAVEVGFAIVVFEFAAVAVAVAVVKAPVAKDKISRNNYFYYYS